MTSGQVLCLYELFFFWRGTGGLCFSLDGLLSVHSTSVAPFFSSRVEGCRANKRAVLSISPVLTRTTASGCRGCAVSYKLNTLSTPPSLSIPVVGAVGALKTELSQRRGRDIQPVSYWCDIPCLRLSLSLSLFSILSAHLSDFLFLFFFLEPAIAPLLLPGSIVLSRCPLQLHVQHQAAHLPCCLARLTDDTHIDKLTNRRTNRRMSWRVRRRASLVPDARFAQHSPGSPRHNTTSLRRDRCVPVS